MCKLSFLLHSLLDYNGARMTPKHCSVFSLIFIDNCFSINYSCNLLELECVIDLTFMCNSLAI